MGELHVLRVFCDPGGSRGQPTRRLPRRQPRSRRPSARPSRATSAHAETVFVEDAERGGCASSRRRWSCRWRASAGRHRVALAASGDAVAGPLRPPAANAGGHRGRADYVAASPEWSPPFEFVQLDSPAAVDALEGARTAMTRSGCGHGSTRPRARSRAGIRPSAGVAEDEATGSAAIALLGPAGARSKESAGRRVAAAGSSCL